MLPVKSNHLLNVANNLKSLSFLYTLYILFFCGRVYSSWLGKKLGNFKCAVFLITSSSCISMSSQTLNLPYGLLWYTLRNRFMNMNPQSRESSINLSTLFFFFFFPSCVCIFYHPPLKSAWVLLSVSLSQTRLCSAVEFWIIVLSHLSLWRPLGKIEMLI